MISPPLISKFDAVGLAFLMLLTLPRRTMLGQS